MNTNGDQLSVLGTYAAIVPPANTVSDLDFCYETSNLFDNTNAFMAKRNARRHERVIGTAKAALGDPNASLMRFELLERGLHLADLAIDLAEDEIGRSHI
jgi:hypothetical protein